MPKRKRMSFTVKKQRTSLTPVKASPLQKQQLELSGKRPRGRPPKKAKLSAESLPVAGRNDSIEEPTQETLPEDEEQERSELEVEDEAEAEEGSEQEETAGQAESSEGGARSRKDLQQSSSQTTKSKQKSQQAAAAAAATASSSRSAIAYIPRTTVEKKWQRADAETQTQIRSLLASTSVPAIASQLGPASNNAPSLTAVESVEGRGAEAQAAIHQAVRALERRLPKIPFPPRTEEGMFEHEELLRDHSALQAQVRAQAADIAALEAELARVRTGMEGGEKAAEKCEREYQKEKTALEKRQKGRFGHLLKLPKKEPADSARRIGLAAWAGPRRGEGNSGHQSGRSRQLVQEARLLVGQLQDRLAGGNGDDGVDAADEVAAEMDRAAQAIERVIQAKRQAPPLQELAVG